MAVRRIKPAKASPTFEKTVQERLKRCAKTAEAARNTIETSKKLTEQSRELVEKIHHKHK